MIVEDLKRLIPNRLKWRIKRVLINLWDSLQYALRHRDGILNGKGEIHGLLFVCKGNVCRSPFAEYYLKSKVTQGVISIDSCGTDVTQGVCPPEEAVCVAAKYGIDLRRSVSKHIKAVDIRAFNMIIVFDKSIHGMVLRDYPEVANKTFLLRKLSTAPDNILCNIEDPYSQGLKEFKRCYIKIVRAIDCLVGMLGINR